MNFIGFVLYFTQLYLTGIFKNIQRLGKGSENNNSSDDVDVSYTQLISIYYMRKYQFYVCGSKISVCEDERNVVVSVKKLDKL